MVKIMQLGLRGVQLFMAVLILALTGNAVAMGAGSAINNYTIFCAAFAMLALFVLIPMALEMLDLAIVAFGLDLLLTIFWFCAAVALAAELGVRSCNNQVSTQLRNIGIVLGANACYRITSRRIRSCAAPATGAVPAAKHKRLARSSGSDSLRSSSRSPCQE